MTNYSIKNIKKFLKEAEAEEEKAAAAPADDAVTLATSPDGQDSIDAQVDSYLRDYEVEAVSLKSESFQLRSYSRMIIEAEEPKDGEEVDVQGKDINVRTFADGVSRLITNADTLLEFKNTILRRAQKMISSKYGAASARKFEIVLEDDFGLVVGQTKEDRNFEIQAPRADRAGPVD